ncbi:MAG: hypothetical protein RLZZ546_846 [Bacteroidota bacterium]|jgi:hypothetical protein
MRVYIFIILYILTTKYSNSFAQTQDTLIVEAACGQCQFHMKEKEGCDLAIKIDNKNTYFVKGTSIDDHGDAHSHDGFCNTIRKAKVVGKIENNRFVVQSFRLIPLKK